MSEPLSASVPGSLASDLPRRIAVTLAALAIFRIGSWIPLPGIDVSALSATFGVGSHDAVIGRVSVMALGVNAWFSTLLLAELAMIALPPLRRWASDDKNATSFQGWIVLGTLALAGFQANGIAVALEDLDKLVAAPGLAFRFGIIATLVSATAFLIWLASLVSRHGLGSGFLLFLAAPFCMDIPGMLAAQAAAWGPGAEVSIPLTIALFVAAAAALVFAAGGQFAPAAMSQLLWPPLLAYAVAAWIPLLVMLLIAPDQISAAVDALKPGAPIRIVLIPALTAAFYFWRLRSLSAAGEPRAEAAEQKPSRAGGVVLAAVIGVFEGLLAFLPAPLAFDGQSVVILVVFALSLFSTIRAANGPAPDRAP